MANLSALIKEINRILTASYPVSLKSLYDIVNSTKLTDLRSWADMKPCQVAPLATVVLDGLQIQPFGYDLLAKLSYVSSFRDAVLCQQPRLLDQLLTKACGTGADSREIDGEVQQDTSVVAEPNCRAVCISFLSNALPDESAMPASLPAFLQVLLDALIRCPTVQNIRRLCHVLTGSRSTLLELLPESTLEAFINEVKKILTKGADVEHRTTILCLAAMAEVALALANRTNSSTPDSIWSPNGQSTIPARQAWQEVVLHFFDAKKGTQTLNLVAFHVIAACSMGGSLSSSERLEIVALATKVAAVIEPGHKKTWVREKASTVEKLYSKIRQEVLPTAVQTSALHFVVSLLDESSIGSLLVSFIGDSFVKCCQDNRLCYLAALASSAKLAHVIPLLKESVVFVVLDTIIDECRPLKATDHRSLAGIRVADQITQAISTVVQTSTPFRLTILSYLRSQGLPDWWDSSFLFAEDTSPGTCTGQEICRKALGQVRHDLASQIGSVFLKTSWMSVNRPSDSGPDSAICERLTRQMRHQTNAISISTCLYSQSRPDSFPVYTLWKENSTHEIKTTRDWRTSLGEDMLRSASHDHRLLIQKVSSICRDFESRCETVEQPLRHARAEVEEVNSRFQDAECKAAELEKQASNQNQVIQTLEADKARLHLENEALSCQVKDLSERCRKGQTELSTVTTKAALARDHTNTLEAELKISLSEVKDRVRNEQTEHERLQSHLDSTLLELAASRTAESRASDRVDALEIEISEAVTQVQDVSGKVACRNLEIGKLQDELDSTNATLDRTGDELSKTRKEIEALLKQREEDGAAQLRDIAILREQFDFQTVEAARQCQEKVDTYEGEISHLRSSLREAKTSANSALQAKTNEIAALENKVEKLRQRSIEKAKNFAEASVLSSKLLSLMDAHKPETTTSRTRPGNAEKPCLDVETPQRRSGPLSAPRPEFGTPDASAGASPFIDSPKKNGRTPKRAKKVHVGSTLSRPRLRLSELLEPVKGPRTPRRQTLASLDVNRPQRGERTSKKASSDENANPAESQANQPGQNALVYFDDISFESPVFTSTVPTKSTTAPSGDDLDETTRDDLCGVLD